MTRLLGLMVAVCIGVSAAFAQDDSQTPFVTMELSADSVDVAQPLIVRVTILVPTWMPAPPEFPSFEAPNLIVRLPERASGPVSRRVDGDTWSGVTRAYRMYPMVPGRFILPAREVGLTYADPQTREPLRMSLPIPSVSFDSTVPEAAAGLDPLIIADGLDIEQSFEGPEKVLGEGDAVVRRVTARIAGSSPLFLPDMIAPMDVEAVQAYRGEPAVGETENRGILSGTRVETATYVARYGGTLELPEISLAWYNAATGKVETTSVPGETYRIDAGDPPREPVLTRRQMLVLFGGAVLLAALVWAVRRWLWPPAKQVIATLKQRYLSSEPFAARQVRRAISARDLQGTATALRVWSERLPATGDRSDQALQQGLMAIGAARYRDSGPENWSSLSSIFKATRKARQSAARKLNTGNALPPLNPM